MIKAKGLCKNYGPLRAVDTLSFSLERGDVLGFLGPNGAGKSTVLKMLAGVLTPSAGELVLEEGDTSKAPTIGYLPEEAPVYPDLTPREFLHFVATLKGIPKSAQAQDVAKVCGQCSLAEVMDRPIAQLSKGYRQRLGLAQALLGDPDLLLLDEPTNGLDPIHLKALRQIIQDIAKTHTVLISSHLLSEVSQLCSRVLIMKEGKALAEGPLQELVTNAGAQNLESYFLALVEA